LTGNAKIKTVFPTRGVSGGWRDVWDEPDDHAELQAQAVAAERRLEALATRIGWRWQREIAAETPAHHSKRPHRPA
jgi:hypothetical protein